MMTLTRRLISCALAASCGAWLAGCQREHMSDNYGRRSREFNARQHVYAEASQGSPRGLDSEEASLIHQSYRESLGAEEQSAPAPEPSKVLLLQDDDEPSTK
ncbi:MAG: hypothetical protein QM778_26315 [Myxococcales bacterium]